MESDDGIQRAIDAIRAGEPVLLATDTVYGLVTSAQRDDYATRLYRLKGRDGAQPTALLAASIDALLECVPELIPGSLNSKLVYFHTTAVILGLVKPYPIVDIFGVGLEKLGE